MGYLASSRLFQLPEIHQATSRYMPFSRNILFNYSSSLFSLFFSVVFSPAALVVIYILCVPEHCSFRTGKIFSCMLQGYYIDVLYLFKDLKHILLYTVGKNLLSEKSFIFIMNSKGLQLQCPLFFNHICCPHD